MTHPLASVEARLLGPLAIRLGGLLVFATALMMLVDLPLQGESSPNGIVSFELAASPQRALQILLEWKSRSVLGSAKLSLVVDFVYLLVYGFFFATLAIWIGSRLDERVWSARAAWAATLAAATDVLENGVLLYELSKLSSPAPYPQLAAGFAALKFALLIFSAAYGLVGGFFVWQRR